MGKLKMMTEQDMINLLRMWQLMLKDVVDPDNLYLVAGLSNVVQYIKEKAWDLGVTVHEYPEKGETDAETRTDE